jgi:hypothetical protein
LEEGLVSSSHLASDAKPAGLWQAMGVLPGVREGGEQMFAWNHIEPFAAYHQHSVTSHSLCATVRSFVKLEYLLLCIHLQKSS